MLHALTAPALDGSEECGQIWMRKMDIPPVPRSPSSSFEIFPPLRGVFLPRAVRGAPDAVPCTPSFPLLFPDLALSTPLVVATLPSLSPLAPFQGGDDEPPLLRGSTPGALSLPARI